MRAAMVILGGTAVVALAGCGSSDRSSSSSAATSATTSGAATTTSVNPAAAAAALFNGHYSGTWTNQTFGSSGTEAIDVRIDPATGAVTMTMTLTGNVFGGTAPGPLTFTGRLPATAGGDVSLAGTSPLFGPYSGTVAADGTFSMTCPSVPGGRVTKFAATGKVDPTGKGASLAYTVTLADGTVAHGVAAITKG